LVAVSRATDVAATVVASMPRTTDTEFRYGYSDDDEASRVNRGNVLEPQFNGASTERCHSLFRNLKFANPEIGSTLIRLLWGFSVKLLGQLANFESTL
jgi:hypothetical protein